MKKCLCLLLILMLTVGGACAEADLDWRLMGMSGKSWYYGQTKPNGEPCGFIVYENRNDITYFGMNNGGLQAEKWDGEIFAINRENGRVDSINVLHYDNGTPLFSSRFWADGSITYAAYENGQPKLRYDREGEQITRQTYSSLGWGQKRKAQLDEVGMESGLYYTQVELKCEERKEGKQHIGVYALTAVDETGEKVQLLEIIADETGSVQCTWMGESLFYDAVANELIRE